METENKQPKQPIVATSEQRVIAMKKILAYQREQKLNNIQKLKLT
jgi:hypothetical protein